MELQPSREAILERERRWAMPTALASFAAIASLVASIVVAGPLGGEGKAAELRDLYAHEPTVIASSALQAIGFLLLLVPLVYLFQAAAGRSERVRAQFLPLVVAAPLVLCAASILNGAAANRAAADFVEGKSSASIDSKEAKQDCRSERNDDAAGFRDEFGGGNAAISACAARVLEDDRAENAVADTSLITVAEGTQFGGFLALAFALAYSGLHAMRAGLLTRFWGSLAIAIGVASVFGLFQLGVLWFFYFALLVAGWVPGGRPPAWAAGEAIPWPTPGEKAAGELGPKPGDPAE